MRNDIDILSRQVSEANVLLIKAMGGGWDVSNLPHMTLECSLPSEVTAISPFVDKLMLQLRNCGCIAKGVSDVEIALREALANAIIHGNHKDRRKYVHVSCRCAPNEVSIAVKDEGKGFDIDNVPDPTAPEKSRFFLSRCMPSSWRVSMAYAIALSS